MVYIPDELKIKSIIKDFDSVIDCNQAELLTVDELVNRIDPRCGFEIKMSCKEISVSLKTKIIEAIKISPVVRPHYKQLIL